MMYRVSALALAAILAGCSKTPPCEDRIGAFVMAQEFIKRDLKAPSTAVFPYIGGENTSDPTKTGDGRCAFAVRMSVDAQNSFGAQLRQRYSVVLSPDQDGSGNWSLESITPF